MENKELSFQVKLFYYILVTLFIIGIVWLYFLPVEKLATGRGVITFAGPARAVSAQTSGIIDNIKVDFATKIKKGDLLLTIKKPFPISTEVKTLYKITAPEEGVIIWEKEYIKGDSVKYGERLAVIYPSTPVEVVAYMSEKDLGLIKEDMSVRVLLDSYPYQQFGIIKGEVKQISWKKITSNRGGKQVVVEIDINKIPDQQIKLIPGLKAKIEIIIEDTRFLQRLFG